MKQTRVDRIVRLIESDGWDLGENQRDAIMTACEDPADTAGRMMEECQRRLEEDHVLIPLEDEPWSMGLGTRTRAARRLDALGLLARDLGPTSDAVWLPVDPVALERASRA